MPPENDDIMIATKHNILDFIIAARGAPFVSDKQFSTDEDILSILGSEIGIDDDCESCCHFTADYYEGIVFMMCKSCSIVRAHTSTIFSDRYMNIAIESWSKSHRV